MKDTNTSSPPDWEAFGRAVLQDWPENGDLDAFEVQILATKHHLLVPVAGGFNPETHSDYCFEAEPGDDWFVKNYPHIAAPTTDEIAEQKAEELVNAEYRRVAKEEYERDGEIEFDDGCLVSLGDDAGAYVQAWIWVPEDETNICKDCGDVDRTVTSGDGYAGSCGSCADAAFLAEEADNDDGA